jgi:hypothetical protein
MLWLANYRFNATAGLEEILNLVSELPRRVKLIR